MSWCTMTREHEGSKAKGALATVRAGSGLHSSSSNLWSYTVEWPSCEPLLGRPCCKAFCKHASAQIRQAERRRAELKVRVQGSRDRGHCTVSGQS